MLLDRVALGDEPLHDFALGDAFADVRQLELDHCRDLVGAQKDAVASMASRTRRSSGM